MEDFLRGAEDVEGGSGLDEPRARGTGQWTDEEWRQWNSWWRWNDSAWDRWNRAASYWNDEQGASEAAAPDQNSGGSAAAARGQGNQQQPAGQAADPWSQGRQSEWSWTGDDSKWWGGYKGDYSDPPSWGGWSNYRLWKRSVTRWNNNTDVAVWRRAEKLLKSFDWELQSKLDHLSERQLSSESYLTDILSVLDVLAGEKEFSERRRQVKAALYEGQRRNDESLSQYSLRRESQFAGAERHMAIPSDLKGLMLEEQAGLSKQGIQNLRTLTGGSTDYAQVMRALRTLDADEEPLIRSSKGSNYFQTEVEEVEGSEDSQESDDLDLALLAIEEQQLTEGEALSFLAEWPARRRSWQENKALKADRKKDRRHFDEKESRPSKGQGKRKMSVMELKKVTRCNNCGQLGHWREDCSHPPKPRPQRENPGNQAAGRSKGNAFAYFGMSSDSASLSVFPGGDYAELTSPGTEGLSESSFLEIPAGHAIVDPGAAQDLIGRPAFDRLTSKLRDMGLKPVILTEKPACATGIGGRAEPLFSALCPLFLGGQPGIVKLTVLKQDVPHLLSIGLLEHAKSIIDTSEDRIVFKAFDVAAPMIRLGSGHRLLDVTQGSAEDFQVPEQVVKQFGLDVDAFRVADDSDEAVYTSAEGQVRLDGWKSGQVRVVPFWDVLVRVDHHANRLQTPQVETGHQVYPLRSTWALFSQGWLEVESDVFWESLARSTVVFSAEPLEHVVTIFHQVGTRLGGCWRKIVSSLSLKDVSFSSDSGVRNRSKFWDQDVSSHVAAPAGTSEELLGGSRSLDWHDQEAPVSLQEPSQPQFFGASNERDGQSMPSSREHEDGRGQPVRPLVEVHAVRPEVEIRALRSEQPARQVQEEGRGDHLRSSSPADSLCGGGPKAESPRSGGQGGSHECRVAAGVDRADRISGGRDCHGLGPVDPGAADHERELVASHVEQCASASDAVRPEDASFDLAGGSSGDLPHGHRDGESERLGFRLGSAAVSLASLLGSSNVSQIGTFGSMARSWFVSELTGRVLTCHELSNDFVLWQGDLGEGLQNLVLWQDRHVLKDLESSDLHDDREFQIPRKLKARLASALSEFKGKSVFCVSSQHFAASLGGGIDDQEALNAHQEPNKEIEEDVRSASGEDARTSRVGGEDARTSSSHEALELIGFLGHVSQPGFKPPSLQRLSRRHGSAPIMMTEVFSPPRLGPAADQAGMQTTSPGAFDLETGWDFFDARDRAHFWKVLREQCPDFVMMSPERHETQQRFGVDHSSETHTQRMSMLRFCTQVAAHQMEQNGSFCIEQPEHAPSADTQVYHLLLEQPGVVEVSYHQCSFITNHVGLMAAFRAQPCERSCLHEGSLTHLLKGLQLTAQRQQEGNFPAGAPDHTDDAQSDPESDEETASQASRLGPEANSKSLTADEKEKIRRIHLNMGHLPKHQMLTLLRAAGAKESVMKYVKDTFSCNHCMRQQGPIPRKKAAFPRTFSFNRIVGIDVFYISWQSSTHAFVNVICQGTNLQQVGRLVGYRGGTPSSREVWQLFNELWIRPFGLPEILLSDGGPEFRHEFERCLQPRAPGVM